MLIFIKAPTFRVPKSIYLKHSYLLLGDHSWLNGGTRPNYKHRQLGLEVPKSLLGTTKTSSMFLNVPDTRKPTHKKWLILQMNH